jgi:hypothetical protein
MTKKEKQILSVFKSIIPNLNDNQKEILLAYGEGMAIGIERRNAECQQPAPAQ